MSAFRGELRLLVQQALLAAGTLAGPNVFLPRDWPLNSAKMPALLLQTPRERKESRGRSGIPQYETTTWLEVRGQTNGEDPVQVETDLETLADQVELVMMGFVVGPPQQLEEIAAVETEFALSADGKRHLGEAVLRFALQYPESFVPSVPDNLLEVDITVEPTGAPLNVPGPTEKIVLPGPLITMDEPLGLGFRQS